MAEDQDIQGKRPSVDTQLGGGLVRDFTDGQGKPNTYTRARNATTVLPDGCEGIGLSTEPANILETTIPFTLIGRIQLAGDIWWLFSTNDTLSEIGEYNENTGTYITKLNDAATLSAGLPGFGFKRTHLITGSARRNFDCGFDVYWADGLNPDRMIDTQYLYPSPWIQNCVTTLGCTTCTDTNLIDANQLRLSPQFSVPCLTLSKSTNSGTLFNGSYQVCIRFAINAIPCTGFVALSNMMSIFAHGNSAGAVTLTISGINKETTIVFPEIEVVVASMVNFQVQAKRLGFYDSTQQNISIDNLDQELQNIDLKLLPISNPIIDKSDAIYTVANYLMRVGTYDKADFNYQPLANQIIAKWVCVEYEEGYYHKGGAAPGSPMNVSYQRGERASLYIRWVYTTGDKSASYHIPGLPGGTPATISIGGPSVGDGGNTLASGRFAGYSSTEIYPANQPQVWGALCGQPIMHHEFPDQATFGGTILSHFFNYGTPTTPLTTIRVMGLYLENIQLPVDNTGNQITNIQGYEILRSVRNGHEHVVACGQINNMRTYTDSSGQQGMFQNYPYNDLRADPFLTSNVANINKGVVGNGFNSPLFGYSQNTVSFHSPDTVFQQPYLGPGTLQVVMGMTGKSHGQFEVPYKHPLFKVLSNFDGYLGGIIGAIETAIGVISAAAAITGGSPIQTTLSATEDIPFVIPLYFDNSYTNDVAGTDVSSAVKFASAAANFVIAAAFAVIQGQIVRQQILNVIKGLIPGRQYAAQYNSSGFYTDPVITGSSAYTINDYEYIKGQMQSFKGQTINNLYRNRYVALSLNTIPSPAVLPVDNSRYNLGQTPNFNWDNSHTISSFYAMYKVPQPAQYGKIDSTKQVPISCMQIVTAAPTMSTPVLFGGDIYINRYTEKNPFFFFNDWLVDSPEDFVYDYRNYINVPYPMFWLNNDVIYYDLIAFASDNRRLDTQSVNIKLFYVNAGYFYLFCNGVRDFFVESTVNVGYRDWEDTIPKMFYDPYGFQDINQMFRSDIIKSDTLYKYDYSLSADKFFNQYLSWGKCLDRDYNPSLAYSCYTYYPRRIAYSLPQEEEIKKDNWKVFLPNNYKDMPDRVVAVKNLGRAGALFLMEDASPALLQGIQSISSSDGAEYTVGTGNLFAQGLQSITNSDDNFQYASCQGRLGVVATPYGVVWLSQNTGKIFVYSSGLSDIAERGLKYDLSLFMPSMLLKQFPNYDLGDNPVVGVGMQLIYDNINSMLYICKKDKRLLDQYVGTVFYDPLYGFYTTDGIYRCATGYTLVGTTCVRTTPALSTGTISRLSPVSLGIYGNRGGVLFNPGYNVFGIGSNAVLSAAFWAAKTNTIGVWDVINNPLSVWVGFRQCFTVPDTKTYYIGIAADNNIRIQLDGITIIDISTVSGTTAYTAQFSSISFTYSNSAPYQLFQIFPITLTAGTHAIDAQALNDIGAGMIAVEIYNNTASDINAATSDSGLNKVFTTQGKTSFTDFEYYCPVGYTTIPGSTPCDIPQCKDVQPAVLNRYPVPDSYFEDTSWTLSYNMQKQQFVSWHDWKPSLNIPTKTHFITTNGIGNQLWRHNKVTDSFCNYYGIDYPFEIEYPVTTGSNVTTLESIEIMLESYSYKRNQVDHFHEYDGFFNHCYVYNSEQATPLMLMALKPYNDPLNSAGYPFFTAQGINTYYTKQEQKYRIAMGLRDYTLDRYEFGLGATQFLQTKNNWYQQDLNPLFYDYNKKWNQLKKIRHFKSRIFLRRTLVQNMSMTFYFSRTQNINSLR